MCACVVTVLIVDNNLRILLCSFSTKAVAMVLLIRSGMFYIFSKSQQLSFSFLVVSTNSSHNIYF